MDQTQAIAGMSRSAIYIRRNPSQIQWEHRSLEEPELELVQSIHGNGRSPIWYPGSKYKKFALEMGGPMWIGEFDAFMKDESSRNWLSDNSRPPRTAPSFPIRWCRSLLVRFESMHPQPEALPLSIATVWLLQKVPPEIC